MNRIPQGVLFFLFLKDKQYITVDKCYILLYTVCKERGMDDMNIILNNSSMIPIYEQLSEQIKTGILEGKLKENQALPSVRAMSAELKISALTVKKAYDKLDAEGFVQTVHGKGTFVIAADKMLAAEARRKSVEDDFAAAIEKARQVGMTDQDIREIVDILLGV